MLTKNVIAIDLAKNVLQTCHISIHGELMSNCSGQLILALSQEPCYKLACVFL